MISGEGTGAIAKAIREFGEAPTAEQLLGAIDVRKNGSYDAFSNGGSVAITSPLEVALAAGFTGNETLYEAAFGENRNNPLRSRIDEAMADSRAARVIDPTVGISTNFATLSAEDIREIIDPTSSSTWVLAYHLDLNIAVSTRDHPMPTSGTLVRVDPNDGINEVQSVNVPNPATAHEYSVILERNGETWQITHIAELD